MKTMKLKLPPYLQRMLKEDIELEKKTIALDKYITANKESGSCLCNEIAQLTAMVEYAEALNVRIDTAFVDVARQRLYKNRYPKEATKKNRTAATKTSEKDK